jgi:cation diffusion facilitator CzcD-associated flavoprotein CzcO
MTTQIETTNVLVIGAGPYGLSVASYLGFLQMDYRVVGSPMAFWRSHMFDDQLLRSTLEHTCPSNPDGLTLLSNWVATHVHSIERRPLATLYPNEFRDFMAYFIQYYEIPVIQDHVESVVELDEGFLVRLKGGKVIQAHNVVMALGLTSMENRPTWATDTSRQIGAQHSAHVGGQDWRNKRVLVTGAGQSAAEIALKAIKGGAKSVDMVFRAGNLVFNSMHSEFTAERKRRLFRVKHAFLYSDSEFRNSNIYKILPVSIEPHLQSALQENVCLRASSEVKQLHYDGRGEIRADYCDGSQRMYDHVICATGYKPSISGLPLKLDTREQLKLLGTLPDLSECAESSRANLFFLGSWAASRFGPQSNFIYGSQQMVPRVIGRLARFDR